MTIVREWSGHVPADQADGFHEYLLRTGIAEAQATERFVDSILLRRADGDRIRFTLLTQWVDMEAVRRYAGEGWVYQARQQPSDLRQQVAGRGLLELVVDRSGGAGGVSSSSARQRCQEPADTARDRDDRCGCSGPALGNRLTRERDPTELAQIKGKPLLAVCESSSVASLSAGNLRPSRRRNDLGCRRRQCDRVDDPCQTASTPMASRAASIRLAPSRTSWSRSVCSPARAVS